jgi:hypothetical protein
MILRKNLETYDIFEGNELKIAQKIQQRRLQLLIHSYLYYEEDTNIISDHTWNKWAVELVNLQKKYPEIAEKVIYSEQFMDWDGSSGAYFTYDESTIYRAKFLLMQNQKKGARI